MAGTLFLQGLSLPWLARRLRVPSPDPAADALARATLLHQATEAGLAVLDDAWPSYDDPHDVGEIIRRRIEQRNFAVWEQLGDPDGDHETPTQTYARLRLEMLEAERGRVLEVRKEGNVPAEVVSDVLAMLDVEESMLDVVNNDEDGRVGAGRRAARAVGSLCDDLTDDTPAAEPRTPGECEDCVAEGTRWVHLRICTRLREGRVLRLLAGAARHPPLPPRGAPRHPVRGAGRGLALVLRAPPHGVISAGGRRPPACAARGRSPVVRRR